jgi:formylglycine-generating enzyme required for sulfatase activity
MIGNAWEWVADEIKVYPGNTESTLDLEPGITYRVIRGAQTVNKVNDATYRGYLDGVSTRRLGSAARRTLSSPSSVVSSQ